MMISLRQRKRPGKLKPSGPGLLRNVFVLAFYSGTMRVITARPAGACAPGQQHAQVTTSVTTEMVSRVGPQVKPDGTTTAS